jgi:hypothetical protein
MTLLQRFLLATGIILMIPACQTATQLPKEVRVPVPVPCEIEQVPKTELPQVSPTDGLFRLAQIALAKIGLLEAENERLRAANNDPCPTEFTDE